jgi:ligand-binding SRPBCC domain-containing protein
MTRRFETSVWVPFRVELVFSFFADPLNLPGVMPTASQTRIEEVRLEPAPPRPPVSEQVRPFTGEPAGPGSEILVSYLPIPWLPWRVQSRVQITEFVWNKLFCDEQVEGLFAEWRHSHSVKPDVRRNVKGTLVTDTIDYKLPYGPIGSLGGLLVHRMLASAFEQRQRLLPEKLALATRLAQQFG